MLEILRQAISTLDGRESFKCGANALFQALGYYSERTQEAGCPEEFLEWLSQKTPITERSRKLFDSWRAVEIVFQVTEEEIINNAAVPNNFTFDDKCIKSFLFLAVDLDKDSYSRTHLADTTRVINSRLSMPAIILFRHGPTLTLSVIHRRPNKKDSDRDVLEKVTLIKDIRIDRPHRAHIDILADLSLPNLITEGVRNFDELHAAWVRMLDTEKLNQQFYVDLFSWFERAVQQCRFPDDGAGVGNVERHVIRLITRLLFVWFLKEKSLVPEELFEEDFAYKMLKDHTSDGTNYYRAILQNLFFATLNTEITQREFSKKNASTHRDFSKYRYRDLLVAPDSFLEKLKCVPFVNGGLFDCLDGFVGTRSKGFRIDAFTDDIKTQGSDLSIPAHLFFDSDKGLFPLFYRYKFTIEENTPLDQEVALDPELLGRVFENLLAAYNPETRDTARKATGSYYTPRDIVDYMVYEALVTVLTDLSRPSDGNKEFWHERICYLFDYEDAFDDAGDLFYPEEREEVVRAIADLRVLDPAVGSGAFPMGVLHRLTLALKRLDPDNTYWEKLQKDRATAQVDMAFDVQDSKERDKELLGISRIFETYRDSDFGRKLFLVQNSIYGVDVQPIACQIAKLRFFISLIVEQKTSEDPYDNYGIQPLPNLETRFVAADALIGLRDPKQKELVNDEIKPAVDNLRHIREHYFNARTRQAKLRLHEEDNRLRVELANKLKNQGFKDRDAEAIANWEPYNQNVQVTWFDPEWMFGVSGGFDVVIGNPPYLEARSPSFSKVLKDQYQHEISKRWPRDKSLIPRGCDLLIYFFAISVNFLKEQGIGCFITQNSWLYSNYGRKFQKFSVRNFSMKKIVDSDYRFFSSRHGPNVNAVISFFCSKAGSELKMGTLTGQIQMREQKVFTHEDLSMTGFSWGFLNESPEWFIEEFMSLASRQDVDGIRIGQGLNITQSESSLKDGELEDGMAHFMSKEVCFDLCETKRIVSTEIAGPDRQVPSLILPRGIGRHFCAFNTCGALTSSFVEVYIPDHLIDGHFPLCLWLYLNSSVTWLYRELAGRKNLGGGLLKAEAIDLKEFPMGFSFDFFPDAKAIFEKLKHREPKATEEELLASEHKKIDQIVLQYFGLQKYQHDIVELLSKLIRRRQSKAKSIE